MTATESLLPEIINDFFNKIGTKRRFVATHRFGRHWRHSGHRRSLAARRSDANDPGCV